MLSSNPGGSGPSRTWCTPHQLGKLNGTRKKNKYSIMTSTTANQNQSVWVHTQARCGCQDHSLKELGQTHPRYDKKQTTSGLQDENYPGEKTHRATDSSTEWKWGSDCKAQEKNSCHPEMEHLCHTYFRYFWYCSSGKKNNMQNVSAIEDTERWLILLIKSFIWF